MSTLRVSNIEAKADASSPTIDEKIKVTSSQGRVLVQIDGKTAGITTVGINTTTNTFTVDANNNIIFSGIITAANVNTTGVTTFSSGIVGNVTGNINSTGVSTITTLRSTSIVGVNTVGVVTAYVTSINDGPISGARNRIINGDMRIDQRNAGLSTTASSSGNYSLDRWALANVTDGVATVIRSGVVPVGFTSSLLWTTTTADASLAAGQFAQVTQVIEGYNVADLNLGTVNAQSFTLSFWVRSSCVGVHGAAFKGPGGGRSYPYTYTVNVANTWEYKTITAPGDITGTWFTDNRFGLECVFSMGSGSTYSTSTTNSWVSGNFITPTTGVTTSVIGATNATWYITGVQLEAGTVATPFERRIFGQELALCQRYCFVLDGSSPYNSSPSGGYARYFLHGNSNNSTLSYITFPVQLRSTPTLITKNISASTVDVYNYTAAGTSNFSSLSLAESDVWHAQMSILTTGSPQPFSTGQIGSWRWNGQPNSFIGFSAEL